MNLIRIALAAVGVVMSIGGAYAGDPEKVVTAIYAEHPWETLPPGGNDAWYADTATAWTTGAADAGKAFLSGPSAFSQVDTAIGATGGSEAQVITTLSNGTDPTYVISFGLIRDDGPNGLWRIIEVFSDDGKYLSDILAQK